MATLDSLETSGNLVRIQVPLELHLQPWRSIYGTPDFIVWLDQQLPNIASTILGYEIEPIEQVDAVFHEYISGARMNFDRRFKKLSWTPDIFVWELKTPDIRIFGWVPKRDHLICTFGDSKDEIELRNKYGRYIAQTSYVRQQLDLDSPKCIESKEYDDVLSDAN